MSENTQTDKKIKILLVEDEPLFLEALKEKFLECDLDVFTASNGKEGVQLAEREHPDVIVTDLTMPIMDGVQFIKKLRSMNSWSKNVFVVILSNRGDMDSIADTMDLGAHHYFVKADIDPKRVVEAVMDHVGKLG